MAYSVTPLSPRHLGELEFAVDRAVEQWAPGVTDPSQVVTAIDRVQLFLRQNGGAATQSRQVASLAFILGQQVVKAAGWSWQSVSEDDGLNPSVVSPDGRRALLVVDVVTRSVMGDARVSLVEVYSACLEQRAHTAFTAL